MAVERENDFLDIDLGPNDSNDDERSSHHLSGWTPRYLMSHVLGWDMTEEDFIQFSVMAAALAKFHERDAKHRGLWRYFGAIDSAHQLRAKATRNYNVAIELVRRSPDADQLSEDEQEDRLDDALDAINYAVFFVRNVQEGRYGS